MFTLPALPFRKTDLLPFFNEEQLTFHHEKHHKAYVDNLNKFIEADQSLKAQTLIEIILSSSGAIFNNAAQIYNHTFYWMGMAPKGKGGKPSDKLMDAIQGSFGGMENFKAQFIDGGMKTFGSGWIWLCADDQNKLSLVSTSNANVPFSKGGARPLLTADVWEHAYYIDYRNARQKYLETFMDYINWNFVNENFDSRSVRSL